MRDVQPFGLPRRYGTHPLAYLNELTTSDKHRDGFRLQLMPLPREGSHPLATIESTTDADTARAQQHGALNVDDMIHMDLGPLHDGKPVVWVDLPAGHEVTEVSNLDFPVALTVVKGSVDPYVPVVPMMRHVLDYVEAHDQSCGWRDRATARSNPTGCTARLFVR